jgi:hypothetical protein
MLATEPVSNTQVLLRVLVRYTSITCISYIPFAHFPVLLISHVFGAGALPVPSALAVETLSLRLWSSLCLFLRRLLTLRLIPFFLSS